MARLLEFYEQYRQSQLEFCSAFHAALPREVRDIIYDHLIHPRKRHFVLEGRTQLTGMYRRITHDRGTASFFDAPPPMPDDPAMRRDVWRLVEYTGEAVAKEIGERWYCTGGFVLDAEDCFLKKFLTRDVWQRGNMPADIVRHIRINVNHDELVFHSRSIIADVESLFDLSNKATFIIFQMNASSDYILTTMGPQYFYLQRLLEGFGPHVYRLRAEGFSRIKIYQGITNAELDQWPWNGCQRDITHFFDLEQAEFQEVFRRVSDLALMKMRSCTDICVRGVETMKKVKGESPM
jgi:hypothetical protein